MDLIAQDHATLAELVRAEFGWTPTRIEAMAAGLGTRRFHRLFLDGQDPSTLIARIQDTEANPTARATPPPAIPEAPVWLTEPRLEPLRGFLEAAGLPVPRSHLHRPEAGIDLLEDVGDITLADAPDSRRDDLYREACGIVTRLQRLDADASAIPAFGREFDRKLLETKAWKWLHWTIPLLLERAASRDERAQTERVFARIADLVEAAPRRLSHRDFKAENLHLAPPPRDALVMIDVQGAFLAPPEYDLVCLLYDLQVDLDEAFVEGTFESTCLALPDAPAREEARLRFDAIAIARLCKDVSHVVHAGRVRGDLRRWHEIPRGLELIARAAGRLEHTFPEIEALTSVIRALTPAVLRADSGDWE
ncbi:MAG: phosphotransferase [bacterium]|nr:phosphotransferase [bacterium]